MLLPALLGEAGQGCQVCWYADASPSGSWLGNLVCRLRSVRLERARFRMIDIRDDEGNLWRLRITYRDLALIQQAVLGRPDVQELFKAWCDKEDYFTVFLKKSISRFDQVQSALPGRALYLVHVLRWLCRQDGLESSTKYCWLNRRAWSEEIADYARGWGVALRWVDWKRTPLKEAVKELLGAELVSRLTFLPAAISYRRKQIANPSPSVSPKVMVEYYGQWNIEEPHKYSDFFFIQQSSLSPRDVVFTFNFMQDLLDKDKAAMLDKYGMQGVALHPKAVSKDSPDVEVFLPHWWVKGQRPGTRVLASIADRRLRRWAADRGNQFADRASYWAELFKRYGTRIYVTWYKYSAEHCIIADVLRRLGGVTAIYQKAFDEFPTPETTIGADIVFGCWQKGASIEREALSRIPYYVVTGYLGDHRFALLKNEAAKLRQSLTQAGARRIIAFTDENFLKDERWHTGPETAYRGYRFFLEKVLTDSQFGLIIKPKAPQTLAKRFAPMRELFNKARNTGRCIIISEGVLQSHFPPALAALAADIAVHNHFYAMTAAVEMALTGTPTLLVDTEGWRASELNQTLGVGRVIFQDHESLWQACLDFWAGKRKDVGNWGGVLREIDPFRDGKAAARMGDYLQWILDDLKKGLSREDAMAAAADRYRGIWGEDKVISCR
ncbi:MAG: hypothetical protein HGA80_06675 [Candidatus Omnitrophica bacterium]|nr:hypothetical protein [Candidatus Omnitrophota bacterium]